MNRFKRFALRTIIKAINPFDDLYNMLFADKNESEIKTYYDAYLKNTWVRQGINILSRGVSTLPWGIYRNYDKGIRNPVIETIFKKNGFMTDVNFIRLTIFWMKLEGFVIINYNNPTIKVYESNRVSNRGGVLVYTDKNGKEENINLNECAIYQNDATEPFGLGHSAIEPLIGSVQRQSLLESALKNMLTNGAMPAFFMTNPNYVANVGKLADDFHDKYAGARKAGKMPWVSGGWNPTAVGMKINELDATNLIAITKNDVCSALGIPISQMNDITSNSASEAKKREDKRELYYETIYPLAKEFASFITIFLIPLIGKGGGEWVFDFATKSAMIADKKLQAEIDQININARIYPPKHAIVRDGLEGYNGDDVIYAPFNLAPIGELQTEKTLKQSNNLRGIEIKRLEKSVLDQRWKAYYAKEHSQELKTIKTLGKYFDKMEKAVLEKVKSKKYIPDEFKDLFKKMLKPLMTSYAQQAGDDIVEEYGLGYDFIVGRDLQEFIDKNLVISAKSVMKTCEDSIKLAIANSIEEGVGVEEQARRIQEAVKDKFKQFKKSNARRIARTEVNRVNNHTGLEAAGEGGMTENYWLSARLDTSRDTHIAAESDNGWIKINEKFIVGGEEMEYPGDPSASPDNIINCVCSVIYR